VKLRIAHLYPRDMNLYGDTGNVIAIQRRLVWSGHSSELLPVHVGDPFDFGSVDMIIGGGGPDSGQRQVAWDLFGRGEEVRGAVARGVPVLAVCGMFQLFGLGFTTQDGDQMPGIGVFDAVTVAGPKRIVGNIVVDTRFGRLAGFENHSGATELGPAQEPLGRVVSGRGRSRRTKVEGAISGAAVGTYLHGPVLPRNPAVADFLILSALRLHDATATLTLPSGEEGLAGADRAGRREPGTYRGDERLGSHPERR